jgi:hypothetical protein
MMNANLSHRFRFSIRALATVAGGLVVAAICMTFPTPRVIASYPDNKLIGSLTSIAVAPNGGFWVQRDDTRSGTLALDGAPDLGSIDAKGSIVTVPGLKGYWIVGVSGEIYAVGDAQALCNGDLRTCSQYPGNSVPSQRIVAAAAKSSGKGLWAITAGRKVYTAGDAQWYGDVNDSKTPTGIVGTPSGNGYYVVTEDGGVFAFGDAKFYGSTGGKKPGGRFATGLALSLNPAHEVTGYWMVSDDGGIYSFGEAQFLGSSGGGDRYVSAITARQEGRSYAWVDIFDRVTKSQTIPSEVITSRYSGLVMGVANNNLETQLKQYPRDSTNKALQWNVWPISPNSNVVQLVNGSSGLCVQISGSVQAATIIQGTCKGKDVVRNDQLFTVLTDADIRQFALVADPSYRLGVTSSEENGPIRLIFSSGISDYRIVSWLYTNVQ